MRLSDPSSAKLTPEGKRELFTGLLGQKTMQDKPEQETELKLPGAPTRPAGLGVAPQSMLTSSTTSAAIATRDSANFCIAYWTAFCPDGQFNVHQASPPMFLQISSPVASTWKPLFVANCQFGAISVS